MDRINKSRKAANLLRKMDDPMKNMQEAMKNYNQPVLSKEEKNPGQMINKFCNMFALSYARRELWDLLDSVIFYRRETSAWAPYPHITYRYLLALVQEIFVMIYKSFSDFGMKYHSDNSSYAFFWFLSMLPAIEPGLYSL